MNRKQLLKVAVLTAISSFSFGMSASAAEQAEVQPAEQVAASAAVNPSYSLGEIVVESERETMPGGFLKNGPYVGLLGSQDIMDTPFAVTAIGAKTLENFANPNNGITDALALSPSVRTQKGGNYTEINIRGFRESGYGIMINGVPGMLAMENTPSNFVESVTIIGGPNVGVNGSSGNNGSDNGNGGTVNFKTKVAQDDPVNSFMLTYNGGGSVGESIDYGQRLGKDGEWGIRVNASNTNGSTVIDHGRLDKRNIYINADHRSEWSNTNLFLGYSYTKDRAVTGPFSFQNTVTQLPKAPDASKNYKPSWGYHEYENFIGVLNHDQKLGKHVNGFINLGYHDQNWFGFADTFDEGVSIADNLGNYTGTMWPSPMHNRTNYFAVGVKGDFKLGKVQNDYVISYDRKQLKQAIYDGWDDLGGFTGSLAGGVNDTPSGVKSYDTSYWNTQTVFGWTAIDTLKAFDDKLQVTLGAHGHKAKYDQNNGWGVKSFDSSKVTPTFAISYKFNPNVMVFADHTENFSFGQTKTIGGQKVVLDPVRVKQNEIGVKVKSGSFVNTLTLFDIKKPVADVVGGGLKYSDVEHKGVEWGITGKISDKVDLIGAMTFLDAKQKNDLRANGIPKWSATAGAIYHFDKDWSTKLRLSYVGTSTIKDEKLHVPSHFVMDLGASYKSKIGKNPVTYDLTVYNLLGKDYWSAGANSNYLYLGSPRTVTFSMNLEI